MPAKLRAPQLFCLSALAIVGLLSGCGNKQTSLPAQPAVVHGPRLTVQLQTVDDLKPVSAVITSRDQGLAKARISGTLVRLAVKEGDLVRQGQVIGQIKDERLVYQTQALEAQTRAAAAEVARAEADLARIQTLYNSGIYAKARLDQTEAAAKSAQANLTAARAQSAAGAELNRQGAILAPATGKVLHAEIPVGTVIMAGQTVVEVTAGPMVVRIELPEAQAASLKPGGVVMLAPQDAAPIQASILQVYPSVTDGQVRADLSAPGLKADIAGQTIRALIKVGERRAYIGSRYGIDFVRVIGTDGKVTDVSVQTSPITAGRPVEVLSGLNPGDVVVAVEAGQ